MILGIAAMVFAAFAPGYVVLRALRIGPLNPLMVLAFSFGLSLFVNYVLVYLLVLVHLYTPFVMRSIAAAVFVGIAWMHRRELLQPFQTVNQLWQAADGGLRAWWVALGARPWPLALMVLAACGAAGLAGLYYVLSVFRHFGTIFLLWDDVVSWNNWASTWAGNSMPQQVYTYPQLMPIMFSVTYVLTGDTTVQFFAKGLMPLFPLSVVLAGIGLAVTLRKLDYAVAVVAAAVLFRYNGWFPGFQFEGFADLPSGCLAFLSVSALLLARHESDLRAQTRLLWIAGCMAAASAVTKQLGLFLLAVFPVLAYLLIEPSRVAPGRIATITAAMLVVVAPFYVLTFLRIQSGDNVSNLYDLTVGVHEGRDLAERFANAFRLFAAPLGLAGTSLLLLGMAASLADSAWRWIVLMVIAPLYLVWSALFSYELRTFLVAFPLLAGAFGVGSVALARYLDSLARPWLKRTPAIAFLVLISALAAGLLRPASQDELQERQRLLQRRVGEPEVNAALYRAVESSPGLVLNNYIMLRRGFLPGLERLSIHDRFQRVDEVRAHIAAGVVRYMLVWTDLANPEVVRYLEQQVASGELELLHRQTVGRQFLFVRIKQR